MKPKPWVVAYRGLFRVPVVRQFATRGEALSWIRRAGKYRDFESGLCALIQERGE